MKRWFTALMLAGALAAAQPAAAQAVLAARVNGIEITMQQLEGAFNEDLRDRKLHLLQVRDPAKMKRMKRETLDRLIDDELLWQSARRLGLVATEKEVDEAIEQLKKNFKSEERFYLTLKMEGYSIEDYRERVRKKLSGSKYADSVATAAPRVTDKEIAEFYRDNQDKFHRPEMVRARHILISVSPGATDEEKAKAREHIEGILAKARAGGDFDRLARENSNDATRQWGGELDPFPRGQMVKAFEDAAFALKPGEISDVVLTPSGFHVIRLEERIPELTVTQEEARERIATYLQQQKGRVAVEEDLDRLRSTANIEIHVPL